MAYRGKDNRWIPTKEDLNWIEQATANGMTVTLVARHFEVTPKTLRNNDEAKMAIDRGRALNEGIYLSRLSQLAQQSANLNVALGATKWALAALHGHREDVPPPLTHEEEEAKQEAALEELDRKLEPYLKVDREVRAKLAATEEQSRRDLEEERAKREEGEAFYDVAPRRGGPARRGRGGLQCFTHQKGQR